MKILKKTVFPVLLSAIWISISEFARNEFFLKSYWTGHYEGLGLVFPSKNIQLFLSVSFGKKEIK